MAGAPWTPIQQTKSAPKTRRPSSSCATRRASRREEIEAVAADEALGESVGIFPHTLLTVSSVAVVVEVAIGTYFRTCEGAQASQNTPTGREEERASGGVVQALWLR